MSERERAYQLLDEIPDNKIPYLVVYMQGLTTSDKKYPSKETLQAIRELESDGGEIFEGSAHDFLSSMLEEE